MAGGAVFPELVGIRAVRTVAEAVLGDGGTDGFCNAVVGEIIAVAGGYDRAGGRCDGFRVEPVVVIVGVSDHTFGHAGHRVVFSAAQDVTDAIVAERP